MNGNRGVLPRIVALTAFGAAIGIFGPAWGVQSSLPSELELAGMTAAELSAAFHEAESRRGVDGSTVAESYLWAMRFRFPGDPKLASMECRFAADQLTEPNGDPQKAEAILERFLAGGPYEKMGLLSFRARDVYARRLASVGRIDEAVSVCRQSAAAGDGDLKFARGVYDALRLLFDLRLEVASAGDRSVLIQECMAGLQDMGLAASQGVIPGRQQSGDPEIAADNQQAERAMFLAERRRRECLDALEPEGSAARLRVDLISHFRLAEAYAENLAFDAANEHYSQVAELGRLWLAIPADNDTPRNLDAMHNTAVALARERDWQNAAALLETIWGYRDDPAAEEAEPWRAVTWLAQCRLALGETAQDVRPMLAEALARGRRLKAADIHWIFTRLAEWDAQDGGAEAEYRYARDLAELTQRIGDFNKVQAAAQGWKARLEAENPELAGEAAGARSQAYEILAAANRLEELNGALRLKSPAEWPRADQIGASPRDAAPAAE